MRRVFLLAFITLGSLASWSPYSSTELLAEELDDAAEAAVRHFMHKSFSAYSQSAPWEVVCLRRASGLGTESIEAFLDRFDGAPTTVVDGRDCRAGSDGFWRWDNELVGPTGLIIHILKLQAESPNAVGVEIRVSGGTHDFGMRECTFARQNRSSDWRVRDCGVEVTT